MKNIPDKCLKCGAPIKWDKSSNHIDCEYCGYSNLINNGDFSKINNSIKKFNKSTENIFQKVGTFSKNRFFKVKDSLNKNKKFIFISILSILLFGGIFKKVKMSLTFSPEKYCDIDLPGEYSSVKNNKPYINYKFEGCWYKPINEEFQETGFFPENNFIKEWNLPKNRYQFMRIKIDPLTNRISIINYMYIAKDDIIISAKTSNISYEENEEYISNIDYEYVDKVLKFDLAWDNYDSILFEEAFPQKREIRLVTYSEYIKPENRRIKLSVTYKDIIKEGDFMMKRVSP